MLEAAPRADNFADRRRVLDLESVLTTTYSQVALGCWRQSSQEIGMAPDRAIGKAELLDAERR